MAVLARQPVLLCRTNQIPFLPAGPLQEQAVLLHVGQTTLAQIVPIALSRFLRMCQPGGKTERIIPPYRER